MADIDNTIITDEMDPKERARILVEMHKWDLSDARQIWCFGN